MLVISRVGTLATSAQGETQVDTCAALLQPQCSLVLIRPPCVWSGSTHDPGGGGERALDMARALVPNVPGGTWRSLPEVALDRRPRQRRREQLLVNGRDRTSQLDSLQRQIERVANVLEQNDAVHVPVFGALCFPFMRREWLHYSRARDGLITVDDPAHIAKQLKRSGPISVAEIDRLAEVLGTALPPAS
jgi:hypothetical protein